MLEILESRRLLHNVTLVDGVLFLEGIDGVDDELVVSRIGDVYRAAAVNDGFFEDFPASQVRMVSITGGSGNDTITLVDVTVRSFLDGGPGNDIISGGAGRDTIDGGDGDDVIMGNGDRDQLFGGAGNDTLSGGNRNDTLFGGPGADVLIGGAGAFDVVSYEGLASPVSVTIDDLPNDGASGEGDNVSPTVEVFIGGNGNDFLRGSGKPNILIGGPGNDTLEGGGGNDTLIGNSGRDLLMGQGGNDALFSHDTTGDLFSDIDTLIGGSGTDTAVHGVGDVLDSIP